MPPNKSLSTRDGRLTSARGSALVAAQAGRWTFDNIVSMPRTLMCAPERSEALPPADGGEGIFFCTEYPGWRTLIAPGH